MAQWVRFEYAMLAPIVIRGNLPQYPVLDVGMSCLRFVRRKASHLPNLDLILTLLRSHAVRHPTKRILNH